LATSDAHTIIKKDKHAKCVNKGKIMDHPEAAFCGDYCGKCPNYPGKCVAAFLKTTWIATLSNAA
jgi:hypothetical protein